ncbi:tetratricopeptide repeat protein [Thalassotalea ganghwensis]
MSLVKSLLLILLLMFIHACSTVPKTQAIDVAPAMHLLQDHYFPHSSEANIESEQEVFSLDNTMKEVVRKELLSIRDYHDRSAKLLKHLFDKESINLAYQNDANLTARQAYYSQLANCLSLTIMSYSLAKAAGLNVAFQRVEIPEYWIRNGQYNMLTGHVNLLIRRERGFVDKQVWFDKQLTVDFDPFVNKKSFPASIVDKNLILAMFYTNKGAQAMMNQKFDIAYAYFKKAIETDPRYIAGWGNLGILYRKMGHYDLTRQVYQHALKIEPENLSVLDNLVVLLKVEGKREQALTIESLIHQKRSKNPHYHALLADEAMLKQQYSQALIHYKDALNIDENNHELHFGIAKVYYRLGQHRLAKRALKHAIRLNDSDMIEQNYVAKLNWVTSRSDD